MTLRCTDEGGIIKEGELVHGRGKIVRQRRCSRYRTSDDLKQFLLNRAMGPICLLFDSLIEIIGDVKRY